MAKEKERKFLPNNTYFMGFKNDIIKITQGYLMLAPGKQLRVRLSGNVYKDLAEVNPFVYEKAEICYKQSVSEIERDEFEYEIPLEDGLKLLELAEYKVEKLRNSMNNFEGIHIDIDTYPNFPSPLDPDGKAPLQVIEIEFDNEIVELPKFCGEEITGVSEYSNITLAMKITEFNKTQNL